MATSPKTTKPRTGKKAGAARKPEAAAEAPEVETAGMVPAAAAQGQGTQSVQKRELFARVAAATDAKKKDVKLIVEATLAILGKAISDGEELNLPPLGKVRIVKARDAGAAEVVTLKLRRRTPGAGDGEADPSEEEES